MGWLEDLKNNEFVQGVVGLTMPYAANAFYSSPNPKFNMGAQSALGAQGQQMAQQGLQGYNQALGTGGIFQQGQQSQVDLATLLKQMQQSGGLPNQQDISQSSDIVNQLFASQKQAQTSAFQDQLTQANRAAAMSGRGVNDPVLRAKLAQEQTRQNAQLSANQGAATQQLALSLPGQRLGYATQASNALVGAGQNALNAYQNQYQTGAQAQQQDYGQRFGQAQMKFNEQADPNTAQKWASFSSGNLAAAGQFAGLVSSISSLAGGMGSMGGGALSMGAMQAPQAGSAGKQAIPTQSQAMMAPYQSPYMNQAWGAGPANPFTSYGPNPYQGR